MKKLLKNLIAKISIFFSAITPRYKQVLTLSVAVIDALDAAIENPLADIFTSLTPTPIDDLTLKWLRAYFPNFLKEFKLFAELSDLKDPQEIILKASEILRGLNQFDKNGERLKLAVALAVEISADGKIDWADAVKIVQALKDKSI